MTAGKSDTNGPLLMVNGTRAAEYVSEKYRRSSTSPRHSNGERTPSERSGGSYHYDEDRQARREYRARKKAEAEEQERQQVERERQRQEAEAAEAAEQAKIRASREESGHRRHRHSSERHNSERPSGEARRRHHKRREPSPPARKPSKLKSLIKSAIPAY